MGKTIIFKPRNSDEVYDIPNNFCNECEKDRVYQETDNPKGQCQIYNQFIMAINDMTEYPKEIVCTPDYKNKRCTEYEPYKEKEQPKEQPYIDDKTLEMFAEKDS